MVVPLALESGELCTGQVILQPISLKSDRLLGQNVSHFVEVRRKVVSIDNLAG